jgi:trehalose 6-phosphate synthase
MRLLTCSNSGPRVEPQDRGIKAGPATPGGLVPILSALLEEVGGHWVFTGTPGQRAMSTPAGSGPEVSWEPLSIDPAVMESQREAVTIRALLWTFHYLHDTSTEPIFDSAARTAWNAYERVNRAFAEALVAQHGNALDEVVLVHDFHLMLVPGRFAAGTVGRVSTLAYFHHVPWCEPDYFGLLPGPVVDAILTSLLSCDYVGFHSDRWADAFLACCARFVPGVEISGRRVVHPGGQTTVTTAPGPIDSQLLDTLVEDAATMMWRERFIREADGRQAVVRVDRLDLWKNLVRGFLAFEDVLLDDPALAPHVWFCAVVTVPRLQTDRHKQYRAACESLVKQINGRFARRRPVVDLVFPSAGENSRNRAVGALGAAATTLINPTFDGLNMVAKESVVVNPKSDLLLSTNCGVFPQLAGFATPLAPFDVSGTAAALARSLGTGPQPLTATARAVEVAVRRENGRAWLAAILGAAG